MQSHLCLFFIFFPEIFRRDYPGECQPTTCPLTFTAANCWVYPICPKDRINSVVSDWLISRRHCKKDWQKNVLVIREKIKHAILDMPESKEIMQLLAGSCEFSLYFSLSKSWFRLVFQKLVGNVSRRKFEKLAEESARRFSQCCFCMKFQEMNFQRPRCNLRSNSAHQKMLLLDKNFIFLYFSSRFKIIALNC